MISRKKKICKECGDEEYLFGLGLCLRCYQKQKRKEAIEKQKQAHTALKVSKWGNTTFKRRKSQETAYTALCKQIDQEASDAGKFKCFFCSKDITGAYSHHHLKGRDGDLLTDKRYIVLAHNSCHYQYHNYPVKKIPWFLDYVMKVKEIDSLLSYKEMLKYDK